MSGRPGGRLVVLVSGNGSNLQAVIDACAEGRLDAEIVGVISNNAGAYALQRAEAAGIPTVVAPRRGADRVAYDTELACTVATMGPDLVVLAGWNRLLSSHFVGHHTTINIHPAKPGAFPGLGAIEAAFEAWERGDVRSGGVMVHYVPDEGVDDGPVIGWEEVPFEAGDTLVAFTERVHRVEHRLLVASIDKVLTGARLSGRKP